MGSNVSKLIGIGTNLYRHDSLKPALVCGRSAVHQLDDEVISRAYIDAFDLEIVA